MPRFQKRRDRKPRYGGPRREKPTAADSAGIRLQKILAAAGLGSRRQCEELIREGRVEVGGQTVAELGVRVDPDQQEIRVDGEAIRQPRKQYFLVNKPVGILSTSFDPSGRPRVVDLAPTRERLFTVGRLDKSSEGLILVTNDGPLTDLLTHPRYGVEKTYLAQVVGVPTPESLEKLRRGVHLAEGYAHAKRVRLMRSQKQSAVLEIVLDEGRNREVRRLLARIGHKVLKLRRTGMGPLRLGNLKVGESRPLRSDEVEELYRVARQGRRATKDQHRAAEKDKLPRRKADRDAAAHPIIDKSLPPDESIRDDEFAVPQLSEDADTPEDRSALGEFASGDHGARQPEGKIDLSPIESRSARHQTQRTVIGGGRAPRARGGKKPGERQRDRRKRGRGVAGKGRDRGAGGKGRDRGAGGKGRGRGKGR